MRKLRRSLSCVLMYILTAALFAASTLVAGSADGPPALLSCLAGTAFLLFLLLVALLRARQKQK